MIPARRAGKSKRAGKPSRHLIDIRFRRRDFVVCAFNKRRRKSATRPCPSSASPSTNGHDQGTGRQIQEQQSALLLATKMQVGARILSASLIPAMSRSIIPIRNRVPSLLIVVGQPRMTLQLAITSNSSGRSYGVEGRRRCLLARHRLHLHRHTT
nr:hypothetical protein CFP56_01207 [Quercus suber]